MGHHSQRFRGDIAEDIEPTIKISLVLTQCRPMTVLQYATAANANLITTAVTAVDQKRNPTASELVQHLDVW